MASNWPTGVDSFSDPSPSTAMNNATQPHSAMHALANDAIHAMQSGAGAANGLATLGSATVRTVGGSNRPSLSVDTAANWAANNPVLGASEVAVESDTGVVKHGDGATVYASLNPILSSTYARLGASQKAGKTGYIGIEADGDAGISSALGQATAANGQMRLRVSRAVPDTTYNGQHFLVQPYAYGMSFECLTFSQWNTACLGVGAAEPYTGKPGPVAAGYGGVVLAFNQHDTGGIWMTSTTGPASGAAQPPKCQLIAQSYTGADFGPLQFVTRGTQEFEWLTGPTGAETKHTSLSASGDLILGADVIPAAAQLTVYPRTAGTAVAALYGQGAQTGDILDVFNAVTGKLASIDAAGDIHPGNSAGAVGAALWSGSGAPATTLGAIGDVYFRTDTPTTANQRIYVKTAAAVWTGIL